MREKRRHFSYLSTPLDNKALFEGGTSEGQVYGIRLMGIDGETADICKNKE